MANNLVMLLINDDGEDIHPEDRRWHLQNPNSAGGQNLFCTGEFYSIKEDDWTPDTVGGEGGAWAIEKQVQRGGITCPKCLGLINSIKAVKL